MNWDIAVANAQVIKPALYRTLRGLTEAAIREGWSIETFRKGFENALMTHGAVRQAVKKRQPKVSRPSSENGQTRMWRAMRVHKSFSAQQIAASAEGPEGARKVTPNAAMRYINLLIKFGYVRRTHLSTGSAGDHSKFFLVRDTGPNALRIRADGLHAFDPNKDKEIALEQ